MREVPGLVPGQAPKYGNTSLTLLTNSTKLGTNEITRSGLLVRKQIGYFPIIIFSVLRNSILQALLHKLSSAQTCIHCGAKVATIQILLVSHINLDLFSP